MPTEAPAQALIRQARTHRSRGARRPVQRRTEAEVVDEIPGQLDMFADAEQATPTTTE